MKLVIKLLIIVLKLLMSFKTEYNYLEYKIEIKDLFLQKESKYEVLVYLESCASCQTILDYIKRSKIYQKTHIYYTDLLEFKDESLVGYGNEIFHNSMTPIKIDTSPTLLIIESKTLKEYLCGMTLIHSYFEENYNF